MKNKKENIAGKQLFPQGKLDHDEENKLPEFSINEIYYNVDSYTKTMIADLNNWQPKVNGVNMLLIRGLHEQEKITQIGHRLDLHELTIEDVLHTESRNKMEEYANYFLLIMRLPFYNKQNHLESEQISFVIKDNLLVVFTESERPDLSFLFQRLELSSTLRKKATDDLLISILALIVDQFFIVYDKLDNQLDDLEDKIVKEPETEDLEKIHNIKKDLIHIRGILWPLRESIFNLNAFHLERTDQDVIYYLRDIEDHVMQLIQLAETYQDISNSLVDSYLSSIGNRTNEVMKVLTIFSTIFIPLTFLAGVYGMNFHFMPELEQRWAYPIFWIICLITLIGLIIYFKKKRWI